MKITNSLGQFDYVLANPPFNVDDVSLSSVKMIHALTLMEYHGINLRVRRASRVKKQFRTPITYGLIYSPLP